MIGPDGYLDWTARGPSIPDKVYTQPNSGQGLALHSIEGSVAGALSRFLSTAKNADGSYTGAAAASVMFINPLVGPLIQCYPVAASTWTSGNRLANCSLWAVESEGSAGTPINANQVANMMHLALEWEQHTGGYAVRVAGAHPQTIWEHREVWNWSSPNAGPTACPSGRYQPFYDALAAQLHPEEDMPDPRVDAIIKLLGGEAAVDDWNSRGSVLLPGYAEEQQKLGNLTVRVSDLENRPPGPDVPEHVHTPGGVVRA